MMVTGDNLVEGDEVVAYLRIGLIYPPLHMQGKKTTNKQGNESWLREREGFTEGGDPHRVN